MTVALLALRPARLRPLPALQLVDLVLVGGGVYVARGRPVCAEIVTTMWLSLRGTPMSS